METPEEFAYRLCGADEDCVTLHAKLTVEQIRIRDAEQRKAGALAALYIVEQHWRTHSHDGVVRSCAAVRKRIESGSTVP